MAIELLWYETEWTWLGLGEKGRVGANLLSRGRGSLPSLKSSFVKIELTIFTTTFPSFQRTATTAEQ